MDMTLSEDEDLPFYNHSEDSLPFADLDAEVLLDSDSSSLDPSSIKNGDYVFLEEGQGKEYKIYFIDEIVGRNDLDFEVL